MKVLNRCSVCDKIIKLKCNKEECAEYIYQINKNHPFAF